MSVQQRICSVPVDAYVDGPPGQSTKKFGYDTELRVRGSAANTFQRAFIQFDAAACVPSAAIVKQPAPAAVNSATATDTNTTTTVAFDVTADVNAFAAAPATNFGWRIRDAGEGSAPTGRTIYASRDNAVGMPTLEVTF